MILLRIACALVLVVPAAFFLFAGVTTSFSAWNIAEQTIENSREIEASFNTASEFIDSYYQRNDRLPSTTEFTTWANTLPHRPSSPSDMRLVAGPFPSMIEKEYGPAPPQAYMLTYWRGEWEEVHVSWTKQSSLELDGSTFSALFGQGLMMGAVALLISGVLMFLAFKLYPNRPAHARNRRHG